MGGALNAAIHTRPFPAPTSVKLLLWVPVAVKRRWAVAPGQKEAPLVTWSKSVIDAPAVCVAGLLTESPPMKPTRNSSASVVAIPGEVKGEAASACRAPRSKAPTSLASRISTIQIDGWPALVIVNVKV